MGQSMWGGVRVEGTPKSCWGSGRGDTWVLLGLGCGDCRCHIWGGDLGVATLLLASEHRDTGFIGAGTWGPQVLCLEWGFGDSYIAFGGRMWGPLRRAWGQAAGTLGWRWGPLCGTWGHRGPFCWSRDVGTLVSGGGTWGPFSDAWGGDIAIGASTWGPFYLS